MVRNKTQPRRRNQNQISINPDVLVENDGNIVLCIAKVRRGGSPIGGAPGMVYVDGLFQTLTDPTDQNGLTKARLDAADLDDGKHLLNFNFLGQWSPNREFSLHRENKPQLKSIEIVSIENGVHAVVTTENFDGKLILLVDGKPGGKSKVKHGVATSDFTNENLAAGEHLLQIRLGEQVLGNQRFKIPEKPKLPDVGSVRIYRVQTDPGNKLKFTLHVRDKDGKPVEGIVLQGKVGSQTADTPPTDKTGEAEAVFDQPAVPFDAEFKDPASGERSGQHFKR